MKAKIWIYSVKGLPIYPLVHGKAEPASATRFMLRYRTVSLPPKHGNGNMAKSSSPELSLIELEQLLMTPGNRI